MASKKGGYGYKKGGYVYPPPSMKFLMNDTPEVYLVRPR